MDVLVLLKAVPTVEELRVDPIRRVVDRSTPSLLLNPFDARALAALLAQREPGERLTTLMLGPPAARSVLASTLHLGADRAVLLSDPEFAGSDALATARTLAAAAAKLPHELLATGQFSTDGRTGVVPSMLASLLGLPSVGPVRSILRVDPDRLEVVVDTEEGTATYRLPRRSLLAIGERIGKPGRVTPEMISAARGREVEVWTSHEVGAGSRRTVPATEVVSYREDAPARIPVLLRDRGPAELVSAALELLATRVRPGPAAGPPEAPVEPAGARMGSLVLVTDANGALADEALPLFSELNRLGLRPSGAWIGRPAAEDLERAARAGGVQTFVAPVPSLPIEPASAAQQLERILQLSSSVRAIVAPEGPFGREVLGRLAGLHDLGIVTDVEGVHRDGEALVWEKSSFAGRTVAEVRCRSQPELVTVRPGAWRLRDIAPAPAMRMSRLELAPDPPREERIAAVKEIRSAWRNLPRRRVVLVVGTGLGGPQHLPAIEPTLAAWQAGLGATRRVVDAGWLPPVLQVGLTGRYLAPELAVLIGVRGSVNHLAGLARARTLVAVDPDPNAPVFAHVDVGIVARWEEVLPGLTPGIARLLRGPS